MKSTQRPSRIEIDLGALKHNISEIKSLLKPGAKFMAVVKADAYGHGASRISNAIERIGVDYLGVAFLEEADEIREAGVKSPIVILYPETLERSVEAAIRGYHISVSSVEDIHRIKDVIGKKDTSINYFMKVNTGMNRYGIDPDRANIENIMRNGFPHNGLVGFNTNLADPLMNREELSKRQIDRFLKFTEEAARFSNNGLLYSYEASGSIWEKGTADGSLIRVGLLMYGIAPDNKERLNLKPVMSVKSRIAEIHDLREGDGVGYGFSYVAERDSKTAVIPVGYADGFPWSLSNKGSVIINGKTAPVVGRVCMDAFMVDVTEIEEVASGDEVIVMGAGGDEKIDANDLGRWAGSLAYEIVSGWSKRMPRIYI
ncbi:MAG: alanine racemase [candidate division Zixibacteria bacterium]